MDDNQKAKIKRFIDDKVMSEAVNKVLLESFLKEGSGKDVNVLAAERLSVDFLRRGFKVLESYRTEVKEDVKISSQVGL